MQQGNLTLVNISTWDDSGNWRDWNIPQAPEQLHIQKTLLEEALMGLALVHLHSMEKWGWGKTRI